jgi:hypothetical protein
MKPKSSAGIPKVAAQRAQTAARSLVSKRDFIVTVPDLTAKDVVLAAKKQGITLTREYVYMVRARTNNVSMKTARAERPITSETKRLQKRAAPTMPRASRSRESAVERLFAERALEIGLARATELLQMVRQSSAA